MVKDPKSYGYTVKVSFDRVFTRGTFKGMAVRDSLPFCSHKDAKEWVEGCKKYEARNGYYLDNVEITSI